jgi:DNA-binding response OmpR family regulator
MFAVPQRVLIVEDEPDIARLLALHVEDLGCTVELCHDGTRGLARALNGESWSLIVLDRKLPGLDGLQILRRVRADKRYVPILMLTARGSETDRVLGLDSGADDYLTKPFSILEFTARVKAILRRVRYLSGEQDASRTLMSGDLEVDPDQRLARLGGRPLALTVREFDLLVHLMRHPRRVFTRAQLLDEVWGSTHDAFEHTVNSHINRLRAKLEPDPARPRYVTTVYGVGYRWGA